MSLRQPVIEVNREAVALDEIVDVELDGARGRVTLVSGAEIEIDAKEFARLVNFIMQHDR